MCGCPGRLTGAQLGCKQGRGRQGEAGAPRRAKWATLLASSPAFLQVQVDKQTGDGGEVAT